MNASAWITVVGELVVGVIVCVAIISYAVYKNNRNP